MSEPAVIHYQQPGRITRRVLNPLIVAMTRAGVTVWGSRILEVRGRQSNLARRTPVNLLELEGRQYLVSPRGEGQWVRNVRADRGRLALLVGKHRDDWIAHEVSDGEKSPILRAYLRRWKMEVGVFFDGVSADSPEEELVRIAPRHPVFVLSPREPGPPVAPTAVEADPRAGLAVANLTLRFVVELAAYASLGYWGASIGSSPVTRLAGAILVPVAVILVWARHLAPKAPRRLSDPVALVLELAIFLAAAVALGSSGPVGLATMFGAVAVANTFLVRRFGSVQAGLPGRVR